VRSNKLLIMCRKLKLAHQKVIKIDHFFLDNGEFWFTEIKLQPI